MQTLQPEINIVDIEKELTKAWEVQKQKNLQRASLFNLVIYAIDQPRADHLHDIVNTIVEKYPCRIIFIKGDPDHNKDYIRTNVATAVIGKGELAVACDQINIEVSLKQLHRVPFIITPHLIPDLPIYLLWGQDPTTEYEILPTLRHFASRLIFDSDCTLNLQSFSKKMLHEIDTGKLEVRDMNWALTGSWREIIAHIFNTEEKIQQLRSCKNVKIQFNGTKTRTISHPETQAIYLQGWIAAQLGWQYHSIQFKGDLRQIVYKKDSDLITVDLISITNPDQLTDTIFSVEVASTEGNSYVISRKNNLPKATIHITTQDRCEIPYSLSLPDMRKGAFFVQELFYRRTSDHYRNMLTLISHYNCQSTPNKSL
jgi:glucose-6-phosphate dehydrogenase assembly protein OpcA